MHHAVAVYFPPHLVPPETVTFVQYDDKEVQILDDDHNPFRIDMYLIIYFICDLEKYFKINTQYILTVAKFIHHIKYNNI